MKYKFAIYSNSINNNLYTMIKNYLDQRYLYYDCVILSDSILNKDIDATIVSSFYLRFFRGYVIFTNIEDYVYYKALIVSNHLFLITTPDLLKIEKLTNEDKKITTILNTEKGYLYEI